MIRNKKLDAAAVSPYASMSTSRLVHQVTPARLLERAEQVSTPTSEMNELTGTDNTSTPLQAPPNKDLLTFSKRLPSPSAFQHYQPHTLRFEKRLRWIGGAWDMSKGRGFGSNMHVQDK